MSFLVSESHRSRKRMRQRMDDELRLVMDSDLLEEIVVTLVFGLGKKEKSQERIELRKQIKETWPELEVLLRKAISHWEEGRRGD